MREILFRGKRMDNGEWVEEFYSPVKVPIFGEMGHFINEGGYKAVEIALSTVGQYTGLLDKNGKRIFEGDIVDILTENEEIGVVAYEDGGFLVNADGFCVDFHSNINGTDLEIIGNIHRGSGRGTGARTAGADGPDGGNAWSPPDPAAL